MKNSAVFIQFIIIVVLVKAASYMLRSCFSIFAFIVYPQMYFNVGRMLDGNDGISRETLKNDVQELVNFLNCLASLHCLELRYTKCFSSQASHLLSTIHLSFLVQ